jgi:hypothetical protein
MSFKLIIDIRGLCLLVPHEGKMHVLLPKSHESMKHIALFKFKGGRPKEPFDGVRWDLSDLGGTAAQTLPAEVVDAAEYINKSGVPLSRLAGSQKNVASHLILGAGRCTARGRVAHWKIGGKSMVPMTNKIRWVIDSVPDEKLAWVFEALSGPGRTPDRLVPQGADRVVELDLMHAPPKDHDKADDDDGPCKSLSENHFHMYWPLFDTNLDLQPECEVDPRVLPEVSFEATQAGGNEDRNKVKFDFAPSVFTCMLAQSTKVDPTS